MDLVVGGRVIVVDSETSAVVRNQEVVADLKVLRDDGGLAGGDLGEERLTVPCTQGKARQGKATRPQTFEKDLAADCLCTSRKYLHELKLPWSPDSRQVFVIMFSCPSVTIHELNGP